MASRFSQYAGLLRKALPFLIAAFALFPHSAAAESGPEEPLALILSQSPDQPVVGQPFSLTLLVAHPIPSEVRVVAPVFPEALALDRVKASPRAVPGFSGDQERWTAVEYFFSVVEAGTFDIGSFSVAAAGKLSETGPLALTVSDPSRAADAASLSWVIESASLRELRSGRPAEVGLRLSGAVSDGSLRPEVPVPESAIFEALPLDARGYADGFVARFLLSPLAAGNVGLPSVELRLKGGRIVRAASRSLSVSTVRNASPSRSSSSVSLSNGRPVPAAQGSPFPARAVHSLPFLDKCLSEAMDGARRHWDSGDFVSAMAALRAVERDGLFGFSIRGTRIEAERLLSLGAGPDEPYAPRAALAALSIASMLIWLPALLFAGLEALRKKTVTSRLRRYLFIACLAFVPTVLCISLLAYSHAQAGGSVVLDSCFSLRVPDAGSARSASFSAGQAARASSRARSGDAEWLFVESADGRSGWVDASCARRY